MNHAVNNENPYGFTELMRAAATGDLPAVCNLFTNGAAVDTSINRYDEIFP